MKSTGQPKFSRFLIAVILVAVAVNVNAYYTTEGQNTVDRKTGEIVQLRGIGLGGWLLPEGYMWGIRTLDRPRQFEAGVEQLIGERNASKFWSLYHSNFMTRSDVEIMKSWGVNTLRIPLLASMLQPREDQPDEPPYKYSEYGFGVLDELVDWCEGLEMGIIWDLHGAPGGQNAENISDSDGTARLWTEKDIYWPRTIDLWDQITKRYAAYECIVGYDLLNEPLLARYPRVDEAWLRELYVLITNVIRETDTQGIIFVEGDDWAQSFECLEPLDWDPHLVIAFHSYPPTNSQHGLQRWDDLRQKYTIPLWHGETGEQDPPWELYKRSSRFLAEANVGWNWWTHKKFELSRQPWSIQRTEGFEKILDYWKGNGPRPSRREAKRWLFQQARMTNTEFCDFLPGMVESLHPLDPSDYLSKRGILEPVILESPGDQEIEIGYGAVARVRATGYPLHYQWYCDGEVIDGANQFQLYLHERDVSNRAGEYHVVVSNAAGSVSSAPAQIKVRKFSGSSMTRAVEPFRIDGDVETAWEQIAPYQINNVVSGERDSDLDLSGWYKCSYDSVNLYFLIRVYDDTLSTNASIDYMRDGIEIYLDADNSKSSFYGGDEFQLRYVLRDSVVTSAIGMDVLGAKSAQQEFTDGYVMELAIPWSGISQNGRRSDFLGIDVHINDNDGETRNGKLAWWAVRDNSYQTPSVFGTLRFQQ